MENKLFHYATETWDGQDSLTHRVVLGSSLESKSNAIFWNIPLPLPLGFAASLGKYILLSDEAILVMASDF